MGWGINSTVCWRQLRRTERRPTGYVGGHAGGNILNLMVQAGIDLHGRDFSQLAVWQADLRNVTAPDVDLPRGGFDAERIYRHICQRLRAGLQP